MGYWEVYRRFQEVFFLVGGLVERVTWEDLPMEDFSLGEGTFIRRGCKISQHYLKNDQKLNAKTSFFN